MKRLRIHIAAISVMAILSNGCASTGSPVRVASTPGTSTSAATNIRDTHEGLNNVLWVQTAAEFWALTTASYRRRARPAREGAHGKNVDSGSGADGRLRQFTSCGDSRPRRNRARQLAGAGASRPRTHGLSAGHVERLGRENSCRGHPPAHSRSLRMRNSAGSGCSSSRTARFPAGCHTEEPGGVGYCGIERHSSLSGRKRLDVG